MINNELRKNHGRAHFSKNHEDLTSKAKHWISPISIPISNDFRHPSLPAFLNSPFFTNSDMTSETLIEFTSMSSKHQNLLKIKKINGGKKR